MKKIHRFLLPSDLTHQIRDVLKLTQGEQIDLIDGEGVEARAKITAIRPSVEVEIEHVERRSESMARVILYCSILKRENFEFVVQKATEVGAMEIIPIISKRTIKTGIKLDRLKKIAIEAAEQSGRATVPIITDPMTFSDAFADASRCDQRLILDPSGTINVERSKAQSIALFIGPEGGWDESEIAKANEAGFQIIGLGEFIMRAETAVIVATYLAATNKL